MAEDKTRAGMRHGRAADDLGATGQLGIFRFKKFPARGHIEKKRANIDLSALGRAHLDGADYPPPLDSHLASKRLPAPACGENHLADRRDAREGLAPEPQRHYGVQVLFGGNFTRGVTLEGQQGVIAAHPFPIVAHPDSSGAARLQVHENGAGPRIQAVLDQFLQGGRRPLDHLARGYLVRQILRQSAYPACRIHRNTPGARK